MPRVYVVEAQALFGPELVRLAEAADGFVVGSSVTVDLDDMLAAAPDVVVLDLDATGYDVVDIVALLRAEAPLVRIVILTAEHELGWLERCRTAGASAAIAKAASEDELIHALRVVFDGGTIWDPRVEVV